MNVLITGGLGVVGAAVARELLDRGIRPVLLDDRKDASLISDIRAGVLMAEGSVLDPEALERTLEAHGITHVVHQANLAPPAAEEDPVRAIQVGAVGTARLLEAARGRGVRRVVFASSKSVWGGVSGRHAHPSYVPVDESYPRNPKGVYGIVKVLAEDLGQRWRERHGLEFVALRFSTMYGPGRRTRHGAYSFYDGLIEAAASGAEIDVPRGGEQRDDAIYVGDVARAVHLALSAEGLRSWTYNIGTGVGVTLHDFAQALRGLFPACRIRIGPGLDFRGGKAYCVFDISRAAAELGFRPRYDLVLGIREYLAVLERLRGSDEPRNPG